MGGPPTIAEGRRRLAEELARAGIETARLDARLIIGRASGLDHAALIAEGAERMSQDAWAAAQALTSERAKRRPLAHLLGEKEFRSLTFEVSADVLVPRPETELICEWALEAAGDGPARFIDLGTGSGAILVSLLKARPDWTGIGLDRSIAALGVARRNAIRHGVGRSAFFVCGSWLRGVRGHFDLIVSNPPYLTPGELEGSQAELRHEPALALASPPDGLAAIREIAEASARALKPSAPLIFEIGSGQLTPALEIARSAGLEEVTWRADLAGVPRAVCGLGPPR